MPTIHVALSDDDYEAFRRAAEAQSRPIVELLREALALYCRERLGERPPLTELPVLPGHHPVTDLPSRAELYDEAFRDPRD